MPGMQDARANLVLPPVEINVLRACQMKKATCTRQPGDMQLKLG